MIKTIRLLVFLVSVVAAVFSQSQEEFHCKPRPGCHVAKCNPSPDLDLAGQLFKTEYPFTCTSPRLTLSSQNEEIMSQEKNTEQIEFLKAEITKLQETNEEQKSEITKLQETNREQRLALSEMEETIALLKISFQNLERKDAEMEEKFMTLKRRALREVCQVEYMNKCFWAIPFSKDRTSEEARELCQRKSGQAANIYSPLHYEMIRKYLLKVASDDDDYFTGMNYDPSTRRVTHRDGTIATTILPWYSDAPFSGSERTVMMIASHRSASEAGIWNSKPSSKQEGVLCEI